VWPKIPGKVWVGYVAALFGLAVATGLLKLFGEKIQSLVKHPCTEGNESTVRVRSVETPSGGR